MACSAQGAVAAAMYETAHSTTFTSGKPRVVHFGDCAHKAVLSAHTGSPSRASDRRCTVAYDRMIAPSDVSILIITEGRISEEKHLHPCCKIESMF